MAKLPDLVRAAAHATGETEASIKVLARSLREGGLITTFGRGRHGAEMSSRDVASLLLGLAVAGDMTKAAAAVESLGSTRTVMAGIYDPDVIELSRESFSAMFPSLARDTLADTMICLIEALRNRENREGAGSSTSHQEKRPRPLEDGAPPRFYSAEPWLLPPRSAPSVAPISAPHDSETTATGAAIFVDRSDNDWSATLFVSLSDERRLGMQFRYNKLDDDRPRVAARQIHTRVWLLPACFDALAECVSDKETTATASSGGA